MGEKWWQGLLGGGKKDGAGKGQRSTLFLLVLVVIGIVLMFISANPEPKAPTQPQAQSLEVLAPASVRGDYRERLEKELTDRLRRVKGVKEVAVLVTLESGPVYEFVQNRETTERSTLEEDGAGGQREIEEKTTRTQAVMSRDGSGEQAVVARELHPRIAGVMVVVKGSGGALLQERIARAVSSALNLPAHRIDVLPMD